MELAAVNGANIAQAAQEVAMVQEEGSNVVGFKRKKDVEGKKGIASLKEQATAKLQGLLCKMVRECVELRTKPVWKCRQMNLAKRLLQLDQLGQVGDELYRSMFKVAKTLDQVCAATLSSAEHEQMITYSLETETRKLLPNPLFALWWLFVPEDGGKEEEENRPSEVKRDVAVLDLDNNFYSQLVDYLAATTTVLTSITLRYNWILKRVTDRALARNGRRLKHVTLTGPNSDDLLDMMSRHCRLVSLTALDTSQAFSLVVVERFLKSQSECLQRLNVTRLVNVSDMNSEQRKSFLKTLSEVENLTFLRAGSCLTLGESDVESMRRVPEFKKVKSVVIDPPQEPQSWLRTAFPSCQSLSVLGGHATLDGLLSVPSSMLDEVHAEGLTYSAGDSSNNRTALSKVLRHCKNARVIQVKDYFMADFPWSVGDISFARLVRICLAVKAICYNDFSCLVFNAPNLVNIRLELKSWIRDFDQADFLSRMESGRKNKSASSPPPLGRLEHFVITMVEPSSGGSHALADERVPLAILEAAGENLKTIGFFRGWCRMSTGEARTRLVARAREFGLVEQF